MKEPNIYIEPDAWASRTESAGNTYGRVRYDSMPIVSLEAGYYSHTKLYSEKNVIDLMKQAYSDGYVDGIIKGVKNA